MEQASKSEVLHEALSPPPCVQLSEWIVDTVALLREGDRSFDDLLVGLGIQPDAVDFEGRHFLPPGGWRAVQGIDGTRLLAAPEPASDPGGWAVVSLLPGPNSLAVNSVERHVLPHRVGVPAPNELELTTRFDQELVRGTAPTNLFGKVQFHGTEIWAIEPETPLVLLAWLYDINSRERLPIAPVSADALAGARTGRKILVPPGGVVVVPLLLITPVPASLRPGLYGIAGRVDYLDVKGDLGFVKVVEEGPAPPPLLSLYTTPES